MYLALARPDHKLCIGNITVSAI